MICAARLNGAGGNRTRYALLRKGRKYPVKKIVSLASGVPVSDFSGGESPGHANKLLEAGGFKVVPLRGSNTDWVRDELILALNLYLKHRPNPPNKASKESGALATFSIGWASDYSRRPHGPRRFVTRTACM